MSLISLPFNLYYLITISHTIINNFVDKFYLFHESLFMTFLVKI